MEHSRVIEWIQATAGQRPIHSNNHGKGKNQNKKNANKKDGAKDGATTEAPVAVPARYVLCLLFAFLVLMFELLDKV